MNGLLLGFLLWIPFILVLITALIMFLISGYKRGLWRSLISLGVTAGSALLSIVISKLIADGVAGLIMPLIPVEDLDLPVSGYFVQNLVQGLLGVTISLLLFSSILLMFCIIGKTLSNHLGDEKMQPKNTGMKWAGLGIRLVDAVIFSLLLVLPFYGTLATYTPVVNTVISITEEAEETQQILAAVEEHPVVAASGDGLVGWVYDEMANAKVGESSLDIAGMMDSLNGLVVRVEELENASGKQAKEKTMELIDYLQTDVVDEAWCYELLVQQLLPEYKDELKKELRGMEKDVAEEFFQLCDMPRKDFRTNAHAILDFAEYLLKEDMVDADTEDLMNSEEFLEELGALINTSEQAVGLKNLMIRDVAADILYGGDWQQADTMVTLRTKPVKKSQYVQDARAFLNLMNADDPEDWAEAIAMMP